MNQDVRFLTLRTIPLVPAVSIVIYARRNVAKCAEFECTTISEMWELAKVKSM